MATKQRDPSEWMWERASELLERADRVQRRFFRLSQGGVRACWEPPVDVVAMGDDLVVLVALPGVEPGRAEVEIEAGGLVVRAHRALPDAFAQGAVRRLEIPQGLFERRIALPAGNYELVENSLRDGCLVLRIRRVEA
ncbi:MAG: Hsp20/alpha crystallin family protein [Planctomycetota bacterium]|nr:Hsp20/alpha crystallin family protein [Planctomycetota bacterium]